MHHERLTCTLYRIRAVISIQANLPGQPHQDFQGLTSNVKKAFFERTKLFFVVAGVMLFVGGCSSSDTDDVQSRIDAVENTLIAAVIYRGSEPAGMSLPERMQHYQVPGVSIAVINNGEID
jgi:hypothetical protein